MHFDKAYVIGLEQAGPDRLRRFFKSSRTAGVQVELFPAVNGGSLDLDGFHKSGYLADDFELRMPGSLGCLLSHVTLWEKIDADPDVSIALICEDDALLDPDFMDTLENISWEEVPDDWDVIRLASHKVTGEPVSEQFVKPPTKYIRGANSGTFCYLIRSSSCLKLKDVLIPYKNRQSMDVLLKKHSDKYNLYVHKTPLAREQRFRYSPRVDLNLMQQKGGFASTVMRLLSKILPH